MRSNVIVTGFLAGVLLSGAAAAQSKVAADGPPVRVDNYDQLYDRYLVEARATAAADAAPPPRTDWMSSLTSDFRARSLNDLLTVQVIESISASGTAGSSLDKESGGGASLSGLLGLDSKLPSWLDPTRIATTDSKTDFKGGGATNRSGQLTAMMTVRVAEVLPNGDLVLEGAREIDINGDRQIVVLSGVVRPSDIPPSNVVPSTLVGQLSIRYFGRGLIKDNLKPGWLIRILNKIF